MEKSALYNIPPLRVLQVITSLNQGGAQAMLVKLLPDLQEQFDTHVVSLMDMGDYGDRLQQMGIPVHCLGMGHGNPLGPILRLRALMLQIQPHVIQAWMYHSNLMVSVALKYIRKKPATAWNIRQSLYDLGQEKPITRQVIRANRFLSQKPNTIIYNSRISREQHERFGFAPEKALVIPNGIDLERFSPSPETGRRVRSELNLPDDAFVVGHVARWHPMKDHEGFLRAAVTLAFQHETMHFVLCGRDVSFENKSLAGIVPDRVRPRFHMLGARNDVAALMTAMDVFCLSSWAEAFPNVLGEAMAAGLPCVTTDVGDCVDILGDTGVVVPAKDSNALAAGIAKLGVISRDERDLRGRAARVRIEAYYSLRSAVDQYTKLYLELAHSAEITRTRVQALSGLL